MPFRIDLGFLGVSGASACMQPAWRMARPMAHHGTHVQPRIMRWCTMCTQQKCCLMLHGVDNRAGLVNMRGHVRAALGCGHCRQVSRAFYCVLRMNSCSVLMYSCDNTRVHCNASTVVHASVMQCNVSARSAIVHCVRTSSTHHACAHCTQLCTFEL